VWASVHVGFSLLTMFPGRVGGSETYARGLLAEFARGNGPERVTVLANRHVAAACAAPAHGPVTVHEMRSYRPGDSPPTRALAMAGAAAAPRRAARDLPAGLDVLHQAVTVPIPRAPLPTVVTVHDVHHLDERGPRSLPLRLYRRWAYDGAARAADVVIATSEFSRRRIVDGMGVAAERVAVVPLGIDHATFSPQRPAADDACLEALRAPESFLLYPANLWPHKNHAALLAALAQLGDAELHLVLAGEPYGRLAALTARARRLGLVSRVHHVGHVEAAVLAALYRRARAVIFPSLHEGFGLPPLEAMACGCPVATSAAGALGDLPADAALRFDPATTASIARSIEQIVYHSGLRSTLIAAGKRVAANFTWQACAQRHIEIYARVADTPGAPGPS